MLKLIYIHRGLGPLSMELIEASNRNIQKEENTLILINLVTHRNSLAKANTRFMNETKLKTQALLESMDRIP